jgi:uncharacterized membrane protein
MAGPTFVLAGALHFLRPRPYEAIVPPYLPARRALVYASGVAEIAGGLGLMSRDRRRRRLGGWWMIATLIGVFPANLHMYLHAEDFSALPGGRPALAARLPVQALFIAWVRAAMRR